MNKTQKVKKLEKQKRRLQRSISRSYEKNKQGKEYCKTKNVIKKEKLLLTLNHRLTNIRHDHLDQITSEIVKREPSFICMEDLNVKGMMKNRHLSKAVQQQGFYEFRRQMEYKSAWNNIPVIIADRFFPSSKLCSCCGNIKKDLKLSDRIYKCECGNVIDRDFQASLNLKMYGENVLKTQSVA
ncbi:MAG: RNA-guided endonuclease InsQ/TnpB family protein [Anaerostipes sp.]|uniref:RNA-guided endonuclease InsQ/TnpB family protein n=1 Tax=Anaerostipes sp. TaxID=1872530 RepID=UPI0039916AF4